MIFLKTVLLAVIGITGGFVVSAGIFAFITITGVLTRLAVRTNTANRLMMYEDIVVVGVTLGNIILLYKIDIPFGTVGLILFGLFSGSFVGCLAVALEEVLQVFPIITHRMKLKHGVPIIVLSLALGKGIGAFIQLFLK